MTTDKKGSAGPNPLCTNEASKVITSTRSSTVWDFNITSKKCAVVITADFDFAAHSCTSASGTISVPGVGSLPDTINLTAGAKHSPSRAPAGLMSGLK
jgi:hypothetical protein